MLDPTQPASSSIASTSSIPKSDFNIVNVNAVEFHIPLGCKYMDYLGGGKYGNVIRVQRDDGIYFAVKKMYEPFSDAVKARRVFRELKLLGLMNHENVIRFVDIYTPDVDLKSFRSVFIVTHYAGTSLNYVLNRQRSERNTIIGFDHVECIIYQLLRALKYLHSANIIHRDLKPSNLAVTEECDLTVLDFGLARTLNSNTDNLTAYVISRWYRSPEVIYWNNNSYSAAADVWSVGCILAELLTSRVLFPGSEAMEQYRLIIDLCGNPDEELLYKIGSQKNGRSLRLVIEHMGGSRERRDFGEYFHGLPRHAVDLLDRILVMDPDKRISVEEALKHPYVAQYSMPSDEPTAEMPFDIDNEAAEGHSVDDWKEIIWEEIRRMSSRNAEREEVAEPMEH